MPEPVSLQHTPRAPFTLLSGALAGGTVIPAGVTVSQLVPIYTAARVRVRAKVSGGTATLALVPTRPDGTTAVATGVPGTVALAADTENWTTAENLCGEAFARISVTAGAAPVTVTYVDVFETRHSAHGDVAVDTALPAGEAHIGEVGGKGVVGTLNFAALAAGDYVANDVVAADANTTAVTPLAGFEAARVPGGSGYLTYVRETVNNVLWLVQTRIDLYTVAQPATALVGDNVASAPKFANDAQYVDSITLPLHAVPTGADFVRAQDDTIRIPFKCAAGDTKLYARVVTLTACANEAAGQLHRLTFQSDVN